MALQGHLADFSATEILQLVATQRKTGRLTIERSGRTIVVFAVDGRIVSTRPGGPLSDDPLMRFLKRVRLLSPDQLQAITVLQQENHRDLEDLLVDGRYVTPDDLVVLIERQILDDLTEMIEWTAGSYRFDADTKPQAPPRLRLSTEATLIEAARRADEKQRFTELFGDGCHIVSVRDLPDPEEQISDEESELFGIIDGQRTVTEVVQAAPLTDYEASEALQRMIEAGWVEFLGRREKTTAPAVDTVAATPSAAATRSVRGGAWSFSVGTIARELLVAAICCVCLEGFVLLAHAVRYVPPSGPTTSVFEAARVRDVRAALELYRRETGHYPVNLGQLVAERWLEMDQLTVEGRSLIYHPAADHSDYTLDLGTR
jgi:Domain of unknown function (DUF4388)